MFGIIAALIAAAAFFLGPSVRQRFGEIQSDVTRIRGDTGDVMASATYQRFATRREAVSAMRAALVEVAQIESLWIADSGRPTTTLPPGGVRFDSNRIRVSIWLLRDRWVATAGSYQFNVTMSCMITAMLDSATERYAPGVTRCGDVNYDDTVYALMPPPRPSEEFAVQPTAPAPEPASPPRRMNWGPVNNTPPRMPYILKATCEGEGCTISGTWAACSLVVARSDKRLDAGSVFTINPGERFTALTADLHVLEPGIVVFGQSFTASLLEGELAGVEITFTPADTLFVLNDLGEGHVVWRYRGSTMVGEQFWGSESARPLTPGMTYALVRQPKTLWWVRVRNATGKEGWIVGDYRKMATGGYMDEIERCTQTRRG